MNKKLLRKFGFKVDQEGIINRYLRESGGWDEHLKNSKKFILDASKNKAKNKALILGSGWLLDVPFEELSLIFDNLILIDIIHPRQIKNKVKKYSNIKLIESEITGLVEPVYNTIKSNKKNKAKTNLISLEANIDKTALNEIRTADYIVSLNLLNQLDILICDYIKKYEQYTEEEINEFRKTIQQNHFNLLPKEKSILVSDYEELNVDEQDKTINRKKLVYIDIDDKLIARKWRWNFDLSKTYHNDCKTVFKVMALEL